MSASNIVSLAAQIATAAGVVFGFYSFWSNSKQARKRATIDLVIAQKTDDEYINAKKTIHDMHKGKEDCFAQYAAKERRETNELKAILVLLNQYEFIASGIREHAFDEHTYKRMQYTVLVRDYEAFKGFIMEARKNRNQKTVFQEFESLGKKWKKKQLKALFDKD